MKKQEIKQDPIWDYIVNTYNYFADNRNILYSVICGVTCVLFLFITINNNSTKKLNKSNSVSSSAQNFYIDGEFELADAKFNELLNGNYSQESINQAIIYKVKDAIDKKEDITIITNTYKFKSKDPFLTAQYNVLLGDYYFNNGKYLDATKYYEKSLTLFDKYPDILIDAKISLIDAYILLDEISKAKREADEVNEDKLSVQSTSKFNSYFMSVSSQLK